MLSSALVGEAIVALVLANVVLEKFGGDTLAEIDSACRRFAASMHARLAPQPERA